MPDNEDYAALGELLARPDHWTETDAARARSLREQQAAGAAAYDQRDKVRVASMWRVVQQLDDALAVWKSSRILTMTQDRSTRVEQPGDGDERSITIGWLAFHRDALRAKCDGLTPQQLVTRSADPSHLSLLGLVRHMAEMERAYGSWPLGADPDFHWVWGAYEDDAEDDIDCTASDVDVSFSTWIDERSKTDTALTGSPDLTAVTRTKHSLRWNLAKLVAEYARHNGHADVIRERIDGQTGE